MFFEKLKTIDEYETKTSDNKNIKMVCKEGGYYVFYWQGEYVCYTTDFDEAFRWLDKFPSMTISEFVTTYLG